MRSFTSILISAALATFVSAAPLHGNHPASVPDTSLPGLPAVHQSNGNPVIGSRMGSVGDEVKNSVPTGDHQPDIGSAVNTIQSRVQAHTNSTPPSIAAILSNLTAKMEPYMDELNFLNPANITITIVEDTFLAVQTLTNDAIAQLETLAGEDLSVILRTIKIAGGDEFTPSQIYDMVSDFFGTLSSAFQNALESCNTQSGSSSRRASVVRRAGFTLLQSDVRAFTDGVLPRFTKTIDSLVPGLDLSLLLVIFSPLLSPISTPLAAND